MSQDTPDSPAEKPPANVPRAPAPAVPSDRENLIRFMVRALRVAFKMASMYNPEHPAFKDGVNDLLVKLEALFVYINPITIGFSPHALFIDGRFWEGERTYIDLAQLFHIRKIKRLEIRRGIPHDEFMRFASKIMLPVKLFIREGGAQAIVKEENYPHIAVDTLDYSVLLRGEGEEIKDILPYLFMEAVEGNDSAKFEELAESFSRVVGKFNSEDLLQNEELHKDFAKFFQYLKETSEEKHRVAAKQLLKTVVSARKIPAESKLENLKLLISDLSEADMASTLWEEIIGNERFDSQSFNIFSRIIDKERHREIATSLHTLFQTDNPGNRRAETESKIHALLSGVSSQIHSEMYRQVLSNVLNETTFEKKITLDRNLLERNYRFLLLVLLSQENEEETAAADLDRIAEEWPRVVEEADFEFLLAFDEVLANRAAASGAESAYGQARTSIAEHVNNCILRGETGPELDLFINRLGRGLYPWESYAGRVFNDRIVTPSLLLACFRFFPGETEAFRAEIMKKGCDGELLGRIADALKLIDTTQSLDLLERIYEAGDDAVKVMALQAMQNLKEFDEAFLFQILDHANELIQAEVLILLLRNPRTKHVAFTMLLGRPSPFGLNNKALLRNLGIIERCGLTEAARYIEPLAERRFFWNRKIRQEARRVLEAWRAR